MNSTYDDMKQLDLDVLPQRAVQRPLLVPMKVIHGIKTIRHSYRKCIAYADLDEDLVAGYLGINSTQFSKILNGKGKNLDDDKVEMLETVCGFKIPSQYLAYKDGYELSSIESDLERENRLLREENIKKEHELETIKSFLNLKVVTANA